MGYNESIQIINYAKDIDIEFNLKLFLLVVTFFYMVGLIWLTFKWDNDKNYVNFIKTFLIRLPFGIFLAFYPLFCVYLFRSVSWEWFYGLMVAFYSYGLVIMFIGIKLGMFEFAASLIGIKSPTKNLEVKGKW